MFMGTLFEMGIHFVVHLSYLFLVVEEFGVGLREFEVEKREDASVRGMTVMIFVGVGVLQRMDAAQGEVVVVLE